MEIKNNYDLNNHDTLQNLIEKDILDRNKHIANIMRIFNLMQSSITVGIDGNWGTGKTVFVKELIYVANNEESTNAGVPKLNGREIDQFRENFNIYYFNAWESDIYDNPLEVFLLNILQFQKQNANIADKTAKNILEKVHIFGKPFLNVVTKLFSGGTLDIESFEFGQTQEEILLESTIDIRDKQDCVKEIIELLTLEKKIIIVVDELDRCKPTFAVELLEVIKHYFDIDKLNFIISFNKEQLEHTINHYYGSKFNSTGYLDKFIDFDYILPRPDMDNFIENIELDATHRKYCSQIQRMLCDHFDFSLRDINKFYLLCEMVSYESAYLNSSTQYIKFILLPFYSLALKIHNSNSFKQFINGNDKDGLLGFFKDNHENIARLYSALSLDYKIATMESELLAAYITSTKKQNTLAKDNFLNSISFIN